MMRKLPLDSREKLVVWYQLIVWTNSQMRKQSRNTVCIYETFPGYTLIDRHYEITTNQKSFKYIDYIGGIGIYKHRT